MPQVLVKVELNEGEVVWDVYSTHSSLAEAKTTVTRLKTFGIPEDHILIEDEVS